MTEAGRSPGQLWREHPFLVLIAAVALPFGLYARFKGLDTWPLGIDEYYIAQSVQNLLRAGWPAYECGGFYPRGLLVQYLAAGLQLAGLGPELAPRLIAGVCSLIVLPAAYIIGARVHSRAVGLLAVIVLTLSVWEVEMGRFARMYAPFQAVFVWYVVFFLKYTLDRQTRALWGMAVLSVVGILVWEGGIFLAMANFLPPLLMQTSGRLTRKDWLFFAGAALLMLPIYLFVSNKFQYLGDNPFPPQFAPQGFGMHGEVRMPDQSVLQHPLMLAFAAVPLILAAMALRWVASFRSRWLIVVGLLAVMGAAAMHQFMLVAALLLLLLLIGLVGWRELITRAAWPFWGAIALSALFWFSYGIWFADWDADAPEALVQISPLIAVAYELLRFPDVIMQVVRPWARAVPILALALFVSIGAACLHTILTDRQKRTVPTALQAVLVLLVVMVMAASAAETPRTETRYVFFLYPLAVIVGLTLLARASQTISSGQYAVLATAVAGLGVFALTEDFRPYHLTHVDDEGIHFRTHVPYEEGAHLNARSNVRAAADWLDAHVKNSDLVVNSYQSLEFYYPDVDYYFMDIEDPRFIGWSCARGTVTRWNNKPLLYTIAMLQARIAAAPRAFFIADFRKLDEALPYLTPWQPKILWQQGTIAVVGFGG